MTRPMAGLEREFRSVCVFCGSSLGANEGYRALARELGAMIASRGLRLVYGGGNVGLMGVLADAALAAGGEVVGVIPQHLVDREVAHAGLSDLRVVRSMHERKALMAELADGFVALPGGLGTMEEFFEIWTWGQLGLHRKPYALLDTAGFFDPLIAFLDRLVAERFLKPAHREMLLVDTDPARLLDRLTRHEVPAVAKWIDRATT
ncbi:MAG TPA: TIGR00730 family Rossman fold protein [Gemmatimonadaceae bacterium]